MKKNEGFRIKLSFTRVGDYRVICQVNTENKVVTIYHVRHRKDAYKR
ncbi:MAG: type II toxin-antitoxin system RelE family toxin [Nitrospirota bacterium]